MSDPVSLPDSASAVPSLPGVQILFDPMSGNLSITPLNGFDLNQVLILLDAAKGGLANNLLRQALSPHQLVMASNLPPPMRG